MEMIDTEILDTEILDIEILDIEIPEFLETKNHSSTLSSYRH